MKKEKNRKLIWVIVPSMAVILLGIFTGMMMKEEPETSQKESETVAKDDSETVAQKESETVKESEEIQAVTEEKTGKYADTSSYEELDALYQDYFLMGTGCEAIHHWNNTLAEIGNPDKEALISRMYNSITFGNEFKPAYNFDASSKTLFKVNFAAEELLNWARENGVGVRGHTLVWHGQINPSIFAKDFMAYSNGKLTLSDTDELDKDCLVSREVLLERLKTYIYGVLEYTYQNGYADVIYAWDVVNEACDESQPDGLRRSYWYQIIGPDYLYYCFLYAREAVVLYSGQYASLYGLNPETDDLSSIQPKLFYNDYNEWIVGKSNAIVRFLTEEAWNEKHKKVTSPVIRPDGDGTIYGDGLIDGIGMQGHLDDTQNIEQYMTALEKYNAAVGEVHITELDVGCTGTDANAEFYQAKFYYEFFTRLIEEVKKGVNLTSVTLWGLTDDASWRKDVNPLLFNGDLSKKPAFEALVMAAKGREFSLTALKIAVDAKDMHVTFEPYKENGKTKTVTPQSVGIYSRGTGHQSVVTIVNTENHTEDATIGFAVRVSRSEKDASMKMDLSSYIGRVIQITAFVKTQDKKILMGLDTTTSQPLVEKNASDDWVEVSARCSIPKDLNSANLYFETDGNADFYVDDIDITVISQNGEMSKTENHEGKDMGTDKSDHSESVLIEKEGMFNMNQIKYRNVFAETGIDHADIEKRLEEIKQFFFYGGEDKQVYFPVGNDMAYIMDTGNHDVRTEGMSYGMMICVQLDMKEEFDRLWKWAKKYMWMTEGYHEGYFAWSCAPDGRKNSDGPAPDGEEYFAMALFFASHRWGDGEGIYEYSREARDILSACLHKGQNGRPGSPMWNLENHQILFVPGIDFTDPSYHLPHFYELFALWAKEEDREFWKKAADASRDYLVKACHPVTGFSPEYAEFDATPMSRQLPWSKDRHDWFFSDSYRTVANIGLDYQWFGVDQGQCAAAKNIQRFLTDYARKNSYHIFEVDGRIAQETVLHPVAITATVAQSVLAAETEYSREWVERFWNTPMRSDDRRYYDNCLYFFAFLALSGNYRIW